MIPMFSKELELEIIKEIESRKFDSQTTFAIQLAMAHFIHFFNYSCEKCTTLKNN